MAMTHRTKQIRRAALEALSPAHPYALPESTMLSFVDDLVKPPLTPPEQQETLAWLDGGKYAVRVAGALDPDAPEWVITALGKTLLASL